MSFNRYAVTINVDSSNGFGPSNVRREFDSMKEATDYVDGMVAMYRQDGVVCQFFADMETFGFTMNEPEPYPLSRAINGTMTVTPIREWQTA